MDVWPAPWLWPDPSSFKILIFSNSARATSSQTMVWSVQVKYGFRSNWENLIRTLTSQWRDASANHHAPRRNEDWAKESCAPEVTLFLRPSNFFAIMEDLRLFCAEFVISERFSSAQDWLCKVDSVTCCSSINLVLLLQLCLSWFWTAISKVNACWTTQGYPRTRIV